MALPMCPRTKHCSQWAMIYISYCLCSFKDGLSLTLGLISVISWGVAEIPQIVTNYKQKSAHGLSIAFLITWIIGDLFNLFGCLLEPATLPTQFYMALLYTFITTILSAQAIYYGHVYHRKRCNSWHQEAPNLNQTEEIVKLGQGINYADLGQACVDNWRNGSRTYDKANVASSPIPLPAIPHDNSPGRDLYYVSARSLSRSHTPTVGSFLAQRMSPTSYPIRNSIAEPLLDADGSTRSAPDLKPKTMLCVVFVVAFLGILGLHESSDNRPAAVYGNKNQGFVLQLGRKLLQVNGGMLHETDIVIGSILGWAMAAIYMGGRLPQIFLNIKRGNVEGLNPLMFVFALVGNITYVLSILVSSLKWSKIKPNLPWLVDAAGCVLLDTFILIQFIYFCYWIPQSRARNKISQLR